MPPTASKMLSPPSIGVAGGDGWAKRLTVDSIALSVRRYFNGMVFIEVSV